MKKYLFIVFYLCLQTAFAQTNIAVPSYASSTNTFNASTGNIKFYLNGVSQAITVGRGANAVCFYGSDMFVAMDDNLGAKGIIWYANVSFSGGSFSSNAPVVLANGQGTFSVATDASGNIYSANNNGTITKFIRSNTAPNYSAASVVNTIFWSNGGFAETSGVFVDNDTQTLWATSYANNQGAVVKLSDFDYADGFGNNHKIKRFADNNVPNSLMQNPEGIAKDISGNIWIANNNNNYVLRLNNSTVTSFINDLNAEDYSFITLNSSQLNDFAATASGHQLGGLVYDNLYSSKMYVNDQLNNGNTFVYSFIANNLNPAFSATAMSQIFPGAGQCAIIPCALLPTPNNPTASGATINSGQTATLTASNCAADQTYLWKQGPLTVGTNAIYTTQALNSSTNYTVFCVRGGTCQSTGLTVAVTVNTASIAVTANPTTVCEGSYSQLTVSGCAGNITWNTGQTATTFYDYPVITTTYTATCSAGGSASATVTVNPNPAPTITSSVPTTISDCGNNEVVYLHTNETTTLTATGCTGTITWDDYTTTSTGNSLVVAAPSLEVGVNGMKYININCMHSNGCLSYAFMTILNQFATDDNFSTAVNTPFTGNVITNDTETSVGWGAYGPATTAHGTISWVLGTPRPTGVFTYTPNSGFEGTDTFTYFVSDDLTCSKRATVTITVGNPCVTNIAITTANYPSYTANQVVKASEYVTTSSPPNIVINNANSNKLTYQAGKAVTLSPGFSVNSGAVFSAQIGACGNINAHQTFYVEGRNLKDPCGNTVILKGVNKMNIWTDQAGASFPEIAQTGANAVRIVWEVNEGGSPTNDATLDNLIALCIAQKMIPIVEVHDATCNWAGLQSLVDYWKRPAILSIINKYKHAMLLNIGNEVGDYSVTAAQFQAGYNSAVSQLRTAGITVPLMIDAPNCGNDIDVLLQTGQNIITADPLHNILFSVHTYWPMNDAPYPNANPNVPPHSGYGTQTFITTKFEAAFNANLPLLVGELANYGAWNWNYDFCQQYGQVNYQWIASECQRLGIGYLAWEWGPGNTGGGNANCNVMDMTTNNTYASLWGWGLAIATNATYGLITAQKTPYILSGFQSCN